MGTGPGRPLGDNGLRTQCCFYLRYGADPPAQDLDPFKLRLLADKQRKILVLWYRSARIEAETAGEIERNERLLRDLVGTGS